MTKTQRTQSKRDNSRTGNIFPIHQEDQKSKERIIGRTHLEFEALVLDAPVEEFKSPRAMWPLAHVR